ncbi:MAG: hypothetical protein M9924_00765 [Rhizobiaceae bacterium]|nr:hypothetical protein [Rhizobiaceae bacterium]
MSEHKTSSFLAKFLGRETTADRKESTAMPSTGDLAETILQLRDDALQIHNDYRDSSHDLENRIARVSSQLSKLYPVINTIYRSFVDKSAVATDLERELDLAKQNLHAATEDLDDHKARLSERTSEIEMLVQERQQIRGELERYEKEADEHRRLREAAELELHAGARRTKELERRIVEFSEEKNLRDTAYFEAKRNIARLTSDLGETRLALEARTTSFEKLKAEMADEEASKARINSELIRTTNECRSLRSQLSQLEKEQIGTRKRYDAQAKRLTLKAAELEREQETLRARLAANERITRSQHMKLERAHDYIGYLQSTLRRLTDSKQVDGPLGIDFDYDFALDGGHSVGSSANLRAETYPNLSVEDAQGAVDNEIRHGQSEVIKLTPRPRK